jgi:capsular polysaccharide biosynthesis protein
MENLNKNQWLIFWITVVVIACVLMLRLWALKPLYTNPEMRNRVQTLIQATANREGWLLSGITIHQIQSDTVQLMYRSYVRGEDQISCHTLSLTTGLLSLCDAS